MAAARVYTRLSRGAQRALTIRRRCNIVCLRTPRARQPQQSNAAAPPSAQHPPLPTRLGSLHGTRMAGTSRERVGQDPEEVQMNKARLKPYRLHPGRAQKRRIMGTTNNSVSELPLHGYAPSTAPQRWMQRRRMFAAARNHPGHETPAHRRRSDPHWLCWAIS